MPGWSSLPSDLLRRIGDYLKASNDIDTYLDMRAVCPNWRSAIAEPSPLGAGAGAEHDFRPHHWVMLSEPKHYDFRLFVHEWEEDEGDADDDDYRLFVNVSTGRILRRRLPWLRHNVLVAASDGLLVLADREEPFNARVLNPFTGSVLTFAAPLPLQHQGGLMAAVTRSDPMLLVLSPIRPHSGYEVWCARPTSEIFEVNRLYCDRDPFWIESMVTHAGRVYVVDNEARIIRSRSDGTLQFCYDELVTEPGHMAGDLYLLESAGELMVVNDERETVEVFKVDIERRALEPVKSIGSRAFFVGSWCLSVDADMLPSVDANCVYYSTHEIRFKYTTCGTTGEAWTNFDVAPPGFPIWRYDLGEGRAEEGSGILVPGDVCCGVRPFSLLQLLATYCQVVPSAYEHLRRIHLPPLPAGMRRLIITELECQRFPTSTS